jgi:hypothetical protein
MATNWKEILKDAKFEDVDKDLNGLPTMLASRYDPAKYQARMAAAQPVAAPATSTDPRYKSTLGKIASALSGVVRGGTYGLLDPVTKMLYPAGSAVLEKSKSENPTESAIGETVGTIGSAFLNPASAGKAGIGMLRAAIPGSKLLPIAARNAVMSSTAAIPQAAGELAQGEGAGRVAGNFAGNMALGTAFGTAGEKFLSKLPNILRQLKKTTTATAIRQGLDIDPRSFKNAATIGGKIKSAGAVRGRAEDLGEGLIDLMNKEGVVDEASKEAWLAAQKAKWRGVDTAFDKSGAKVSDFSESINADPVVQNFLKTHGKEGAAKLQKIIDQADNKKGIGDIRKFLQDRIDYFRKAPKDEIDADAADVVKAIRDAVDYSFVPKDLKADYSKYKAIDDALTREDLRMPKTFGAGSQTAGRMIGSGLAGGVLGGVSGVDANDPDSLRKALTRSAIGFAAGSIAPRAGAAIANKLTGRLAARIAPLIPELGAMTGGRAGSVVSRLGARAIGPEDVASITESPAPSTPIPATTPTEKGIQKQEDAAAPENVAAAKEATNSAWAETVRARLEALYDSQLSQYSDVITKEEFFQQAEKLTDGFDPRKTAGFIFTDKAEKENYLRSYDSALRLQNYQKDYSGKGQDFIGSALQPSRGPLGVMGKGTEEQIAYNQLRDWAVSLMTEKGKAPAKATIEQVSRDLDAIIGMRIPAERKRQLVIDHLANYGLNVEQLMRYGQLEGVT